MMTISKENASVSPGVVVDRPESTTVVDSENDSNGDDMVPNDGADSTVATPVHSIAYRGHVDWADYMNSAQAEAAPSSRPKELVIRWDLPLVVR